MTEVASDSLVLVVEDDRDILYAVTEILQDEGYVVHPASEGQTALNWLEHHHPALILLDLMMQGVNGWQFMGVLRQRDETKNIPVILVSANPKLHREATVLAAADYIPKPFNIDDLLSKVSRFAAPITNT